MSVSFVDGGGCSSIGNTISRFRIVDDRHFCDWFLWFPVKWNWFVVVTRRKHPNQHHRQYITHLACSEKLLMQHPKCTTIFPCINANCWLQIMSVNDVLIRFSLCGGGACFRCYEHCLSNLSIWFLLRSCRDTYYHFIATNWKLCECKMQNATKKITTPNWRKRNMIMIKMLEWKQHLALAVEYKCDCMTVCTLPVSHCWDRGYDAPAPEYWR